ncbi:hypothetical protein F5I97DRAFT_1808542, partial [Phlebopus sp. FC_14]
GFWFSSINLGFQAPIQESERAEAIFYHEALAVCAAILEASSFIPFGGHLAVFTDNFNTVQLFNSLSALPPKNWTVMRVSDVVTSHQIDFRVFHISGVHNVVTDLLSRLRNRDAVLGSPVLSIQSPRRTLGAAPL